MSAAALAVAYSGGRDSTALLHAAAVQARDAGLAVHALHVHHGLSPHAGDWLAHCERQCAAWAHAGLPVTLHVERLALRIARGDSVEARARAARHAALAAMARAAGCTLLLLAQHRRDQAETVLLQALRGAAAAGLAAMPKRIERDGLVWARPWLELPREAIEAYLHAHGLRWIDDDSNADARLARNRLRLAVWPSLTTAFPSAEITLATVAARAAEARACLADLAALDLAACADVSGLALADWSRLAPHRRVNVLHAWLQQQGGAPTAADLERLARELPQGAAPATWPLAGGMLRRYRGRLCFALLDAQAAADERIAWPLSLPMRRAGRYAVPQCDGVLVAERVRAGGIALDRLRQASLRPRAGGERLRLAPGRPSRSLKQHYQAASVPAWARRAPLVYAGEALLFVPGLGPDAAALAQPGEPQLALRWEPAGASPEAR